MEDSKKLIKSIHETSPPQTPPNWLAVDIENLQAKIVNLPAREDLDQTIEEALIVEYYSR